MWRALGRTIFKGVFWSADRATWQYDIMVALILGFIFLTPRSFFNDQPVQAGPGDLVMISSTSDEAVYEMRAALLDAERAASVEELARRVIAQQTGRPIRVLRVVPNADASGQVVSYAISVQQ